MKNFWGNWPSCKGRAKKGKGNGKTPLNVGLWVVVGAFIVNPHPRRFSLTEPAVTPPRLYIRPKCRAEAENWAYPLKGYKAMMKCSIRQGGLCVIVTEPCPL